MVAGRACPLCGSPADVRFVKQGFGIAACARCGHWFADLEPAAGHTRDVYDDDYFDGDDGGYSGYERECAALAERGRWYRKLAERFVSPGRVLDIGAANGCILEGLAGPGWTGSGIEPNPRMAALATRRGFTVAPASLETFETAERFDALAFVQVLHHFYDLRLALEKAASLTAPGGVWVIETWDRDSLIARAVGKRWHAFNPPSVLHWFSVKTLPALLAAFGMTLADRGHPPKFISGAHAKSILRRDATGIVGRLATLLASPIPDDAELRYPGDDVVWFVFRKTG